MWTLRPVTDPSLPFKWDKINDFRACDGKMASVGYDRFVIAAGQRGITATDGVETRRVDDRIHDFVDDEINDSQFEKVFGARSYSSERTWLLYPAIENDDANAALIYDDDSGAYSKYIFSREISGEVVDMNVLGYGNTAIDYAAQDFIEANGLDVAAIDFNDETALSFFWSEGAELFLGGDRNGSVYIMETEGSDVGTAITFNLESAGWNPFKDQGVEAQLGYIDFYCDSHQSTTATVEFLKNDNEDPYITQSMDFLPNLTFKSTISQITPNSDPTTGFVISSPSHGINVDEIFYIYGVIGAELYNDEAWTATSVTENTINVAADITSLGATISAPGITQANPGVVTAVAHPFSDGDIIYITDVSGMTEVNGLIFTVANSTTDTFELQGIDTTGFTAYTSGGYVFNSYLSDGQIFERKFYRTKVWKRVYGGGIGYVHSINITSTGINKPLKIHAIKPWFRKRGRRTLG